MRHSESWRFRSLRGAQAGALSWAPAGGLTVSETGRVIGEHGTSQLPREGAGFRFTCPGTPMLQNGQEFGEDHWIPEADGGTGRRVKGRPLRWRYADDKVGRGFLLSIGISSTFGTGTPHSGPTTSTRRAGRLGRRSPTTLRDQFIGTVLLTI